MKPSSICSTYYLLLSILLVVENGWNEADALFCVIDCCVTTIMKSNMIRLPQAVFQHSLGQTTSGVQKGKVSLRL